MKYLKFPMLCLAAAALLSACVKQHFDTAPDSSKIDPMLPVNAGMLDLNYSAMNLVTGTKSRVLGDTTVYGVVVGDDKSGNIYKKLYIQDTTGGMTVVIDKSYLYGDYPTGRKVYLKLKGLSLVNYKGTPEVVYSVNSDGTTNGIPSSLLGNYLVAATYPNFVTPPEVTLNDIYSNPIKYVNTLVTLKDMQFANGNNNVLYSDPNTSTNRTITGCSSSNSITMYNSNYSSFQSAVTPNGNGSITGIITLYNGTPQFVMRDTTDVHFTNSRCQ